MSLSQSRFEEDTQLYEVIDDGVEFILESVQREVNARWVKSLEIPLVVDVAMLKVRKMMAWATMIYDGVVEEGVPLEQLTPDVEPTPSLIDTWARGTVPVRKVVEDPGFRRRAGEKDPLDTNPNSPRTPSVSSRATSNTGTAKSGGTRKTGGSRIGSQRGQIVQEEDEDPTGQIFDLDEPDGEYDDLAASELATLLDKERRAKMRNQSEENLVEEKDEFELLEENITNAIKELKGKKFAVDQSGNVVPLAVVKPETLPPYAVSLDTKITQALSPRALKQQKEKEAAAAKEGGGKAGVAAGEKRKKKVIRVAGSRSIDEDSYFKASTSLAVSLASGEDIAPATGVALKVGEVVREGPALPENPKNLSRKQYFSRSQVLAEGSSITGGMLHMESSLGGGGSSVGEGGGADGDPFGENALPMSMMSGIRIPDIDVLEGGRRVQIKEEELEVSVTDSELGLGPKTTSGSPQLAIIPPRKDGVVDPKLYEHDITTYGKPKDRGLPYNTKTPSEKKHLPAPAPGLVSDLSVYSPPEKHVHQINGAASPQNSVSNSSMKSKAVADQLDKSSGNIKIERKDVARQVF